MPPPAAMSAPGPAAGPHGARRRLRAGRARGRSRRPRRPRLVSLPAGVSAPGGLGLAQGRCGGATAVVGNGGFPSVGFVPGPGSRAAGKGRPAALRHASGGFPVPGVRREAKAGGGAERGSRLGPAPAAGSSVASVASRRHCCGPSLQSYSWVFHQFWSWEEGGLFPLGVGGVVLCVWTN